MIFAIVDCLTYLAERGRYSPRALAAQGWTHVTPETFAAAEDAPPATVFVIHPRRSMLSWVVMYWGVPRILDRFSLLRGSVHARVASKVQFAVQG